MRTLAAAGLHRRGRPRPGPGPGGPVRHHARCSSSGSASTRSTDLPPLADFVPGADVVEALEPGLRPTPSRRSANGSTSSRPSTPAGATSPRDRRRVTASPTAAERRPTGERLQKVLARAGLGSRRVVRGADRRRPGHGQRRGRRARAGGSTPSVDAGRGRRRPDRRRRRASSTTCSTSRPAWSPRPTTRRAGRPSSTSCRPSRGCSRSAGSTPTPRACCCSPTTATSPTASPIPSFGVEKEYLAEVEGDAVAAARCAGSARASSSTTASPRRPRSRSLDAAHRCASRSTRAATARSGACARRSAIPVAAPGAHPHRPARRPAARAGGVAAARPRTRSGRSSEPCRGVPSDRATAGRGNAPPSDARLPSEPSAAPPPSTSTRPSHVHERVDRAARRRCSSATASTTTTSSASSSPPPTTSTRTFPATGGARRSGLGDVPLICARELDIDGGTPRCIRVLMHLDDRRGPRPSCTTCTSRAPSTSATTCRRWLMRRGGPRVVGTGLIGGSIGLALRARGWHVTGHGPRRRPGRTGRSSSGALDAVGDDPDAEITFVATPVRRGRRRGPAALGAGTGLVTDVGSVKASIVGRGRPIPGFVGGHPMAGSEQEGVDGADRRPVRGRGLGAHADRRRPTTRPSPPSARRSCDARRRGGGAGARPPRRAGGGGVPRAAPHRGDADAPRRRPRRGAPAPCCAWPPAASAT